MNSLDNLIQKVRALDNISFLNDNINEKEVEKACVAYLKSLNYKVVEQPKVFKLKNVDDLINRFYHLLEYHHDIAAFSVNRDKDRAIISNFIKIRQEETGMSYESILQDTALIIHGLFVYEKDLGLTVSLGIWVFGSTNYRWVIDKVIFMLNAEQDIYNDLVVSKMAELDEMNSDDEYTGFNFEHLRRIHG